MSCSAARSISVTMSVALDLVDTEDRPRSSASASTPAAARAAPSARSARSARWASSVGDVIGSSWLACTVGAWPALNSGAGRDPPTGARGVRPSRRSGGVVRRHAGPVGRRGRRGPAGGVRPGGQGVERSRRGSGGADRPPGRGGGGRGQGAGSGRATRTSASPTARWTTHSSCGPRWWAAFAPSAGRGGLVRPDRHVLREPLREPPRPPRRRLRRARRVLAGRSQPALLPRARGPLTGWVRCTCRARCTPTPGSTSRPPWSARSTPCAVTAARWATTWIWWARSCARRAASAGAEASWTVSGEAYAEAFRVLRL